MIDTKLMRFVISNSILLTENKSLVSTVYSHSKLDRVKILNIYRKKQFEYLS
jgi:hypothetical protein